MSSGHPIPPIAPPLNPALPPRFHEMGEYYFQDFCRELWLQERGIADCFHYGTRGQSQLGIDLLAYGQPGERNRAGQCKCYEVVKWTDVRDAVSKFLDHVAHWQKEGVTDFTLFVACPADDRNVVDAIGEQRRRLAAHQIEFHVWDAGQLRNKVRPHPAIAATYCTEAWVPFLCGGGPTGAAALGASAIMQVVGTVVGDLSAARSELLDEIREHLRCGREAEAARRLTELRSSPSWLHLPAEVKGRALRLMASAALATNQDLNRAEAWVAEARREDPAGDFQMIESLLIYLREGTQPALAKLGVPATANAWNLQLALLLDEGRAADVIAATDAPDFVADAETHRLRALALLIEKRVEEALAEIAKGTALNPEWSSVRRAEATIQYAACICPSFSGWGHLNWPVPSDRSLVKQDAVSVENLRCAAEKFDRLLAEEQPGGEDHAGLEAWKLACLANDDGHQAAAAAFARQVLDASPDNFRVVVWALERGYSFDVDRVCMALQATVAAPKPPVDAILALSNLHALRGDVAKAEAVLNANRSNFSETSAEVVWQFMMTQLAGARNAGDEARALLAKVSDTNFQRRAEAALLRQTALRTGDFKPLAELLERNFQISGDPLELLECCEAKIDAADPKFVAEHAEELLRNVPTARALQLALVGIGHAGQSALGLELLDRYAGVLGDGPLPAPIWRMRIDFLTQLGRLPDAVQEAERLTSQNTNASNLLAQFSAQFALGDLRGCASTARLISGRPEVSPLQRLQVAAHVASHNQPLAVNLWEEAVEQNSADPEVIMLAVDIGFRLGLDDRVGPLLAHLPRLAASGEAGVRMIGMEEILQHMRDQNLRLREVNEHYDTGQLPIHMCAAEAQHPLADLYHLQLELNEQSETLLGRAPLLARHGAKPVNSDLTLNPGEIYADITAILLAAHFNILDMIETHLGPVRISARLPQSLIAQLHQIENCQPSLQPGKQALVDLDAQNKIKGVSAPIPLPHRQDEVGTKMGARWCAWLERIREAGGFLVDYLPLKSNDTSMAFVTLPEEDRQHVIGVGELLSALVRAGVITPEERHGSTSAFGIEATTEGRAIELMPDTPIFLESGIAEQLGRAGILPALCKNRRVETDEAVLIRVREELRANEQRKRLAEWVRRLLDRIQKGLCEGSYVAFASNLPRTGETAFLERDDFGTFQDMLDPSAADGGTVWCDDRFLNRFNHCGARPLIGISEVLLALRLRGAFDEAAYYALILRLRVANVRYLPLTSDELLHHLRRAPIHQSRVIETAALSVLRRSLAVALLDQQRLQKPRPEQAAAGHLSELEWIQSVHAAVTSGIAQLWREESLSDAESRSDWLLEFVSFDTRLVSEAIMENSPGNPALSVASDLAQHFIAGFVLPSESPLNPNAPTSRRARYFSWLDGLLLSQHKVANPEILPMIGDVLTNTLSDPVWTNFEESGQRKAAQIYLYGIFVELPQTLRPYIQLPAKVLTDLKATVRPLVVLAFGRSFDHRTWWEAAAAAFNGQATKFRDADGDEFTLKPAVGEAAPENLIADGPGVVEGSHVHDPLFGLLSHSVDKCRSFLQNRPELFDCPSSRRSEAIELLVNIAEPCARIAAATEWRTRSAESFYRCLATRLRAGEGMAVSDFLPDSAEGLRDHLRLVIADEPQWNETAQRLISDEGCMSALTRLTSLPIALPTAIVTAVRAMNIEDREEFFTRAEATLLTPVSRFHLVHLLAACGDLNTGYLEHAKVLLGDVLSEEGIKRWPAFHALLKWTFLQLRQLPVTDSWSAAERISLAWVHAARLHNELLAIRADSAVIESRFNAAHLFLARNPILPEASLHDDVCAPSRVTRPRLFARAFGTILLSLPPETANALRPANADWLGANEAVRERAWLDIDSGSAPRPDALRSWLGGAWATPLLALFGEDLIDQLFSVGMEAAGQTALSILEQSATDVGAWRLLFNTTFDGPAPLELTERVTNLMRSLNFAVVFRSLSEECGMALIIASAAARFSGNDDLINQVAEQLAVVAAEAAASADFQGTSDQAEERRRRIVPTLLYAAQNLYVSEDIGASAPRTYQLLTRLVRTWPLIGTLMREHRGAQVPLLRLPQVSGAWPFFLSLRAAP